VNFYRTLPLTIVKARPVVFHDMWDGSIYKVELGLNDGTVRWSIWQGNALAVDWVCTELTSLLPLPYAQNLGPVDIPDYYYYEGPPILYFLDPPAFPAV
jgi:hypothetical protein